MPLRVRLAASLLALATSACVGMPPGAQSAERFFASLQAHCGKAFEGRLAASNAADADMAGKRLTMHVAQCTAEEVRIPFQVGEDRSRTWIVTRTGRGLRLEHDHRHADGSPDALTMYGGDSLAPGTAERQAFPADARSIAMFTAQNRSVSNANVWALELRDRTFAYELRRPPGPGERHFRVEFDLARPIPAPSR